MKAHEFLDNANSHLIDRGKQYEAKEGERSMDRTVKAFNAATGKDLTTEQGWLFMVMLKAVRSQQGEFKADSYEDGAAYFALMGEQASITNVSVKKPVNSPSIDYCEKCDRAFEISEINRYSYFFPCGCRKSNSH